MMRIHWWVRHPPEARPVPERTGPRKPPLPWKERAQPYYTDCAIALRNKETRHESYIAPRRPPADLPQSARNYVVLGMDSRFYHNRNPLPCIWGVHPISAMDLFDIQTFLAAPPCALQRLPAVQRAAQVFEDRDLLPDLARKASRQILHVVNRVKQHRVLKPLHV